MGFVIMLLGAAIMGGVWFTPLGTFERGLIAVGGLVVFLVGVGVALTLLLIGLSVFRSSEPRFADTI